MISKIEELAATFIYSTDDKVEIATKNMTLNSLRVQSRHSVFEISIYKSSNSDTYKNVFIRVSELDNASEYIDYVLQHTDVIAVLNKLEHEFDING